MRARGVVHVAVGQPKVGQVGQPDQGAAEGHRHRVQDRIAVTVGSLPGEGVEQSVDNPQGAVATAPPQTPVGRVA